MSKAYKEVMKAYKKEDRYKEEVIRDAAERFDEAVRWIADDIAEEATDRLVEQGVLYDVPEAERNPIYDHWGLIVEEIYHDVVQALANDQLTLEWWKSQVAKKVSEFRASKPELKKE